MNKIIIPFVLTSLLALVSCNKKDETPAPPTDVTQTKACTLEANCDCSAPGITLRYAINYCMGKTGTHDCESNFPCIDEMKEKFKSDLAGKSECEQNQFYRQRYCEDFHKDTLQECLKAVPGIVQTGC